MGLDARTETGIERYLLFRVEGPSLIRAELSEATGRSRVCLWRGNQVEQRVCRSMRNGVLERPVFDTGFTNWTLTLIGVNDTTSPIVDLTLDFNAGEATVTFENFRFQGVPVPNYNGFTASVDTEGPGELQVTGRFDPGEQHEYRVVISEAGVGIVKDETGGPANSFEVTHPVEAVTSYQVAVSNPNTSAEPLPVFLRSTLSWPRLQGP
jgi:hypothetical protein